MLTTTCYLLHFERPIGNPDNPLGQAQHYYGSTSDLAAELVVHARTTSHAAIMREVNRQGIPWVLARTWPGSRGRERRLKDMGGARRHCPECGADPPWYMRGDVMIGGYSTVAAELNRRFAADPPIDRRQVAAWHKRGTANRTGQLPPEPVETRPMPPRTTPRYLFETGDWVAWTRPGVPGPRNKGWRILPELAEPAAPQLPPRVTGRLSEARKIERHLQPAGE
jgi:hypothetical protein